MFVTHGPASSGTVCLTFDDGPDPDLTPRLLDVLAKAEAKATFFVIGQSVEKYPHIVRRIQSEGHAIGHHSYSHPDPAVTSATRMREELRQASTALEQVLGQRVRLYRPPRGRLGIWDMPTVWAHGQTIVLWNVDPGDFRLPTADLIRESFDARPLRGGDLVLLHDRAPQTIEAIPGLLARARHDGLKLDSIEAWVRPFAGLAAKTGW